ncbi:sigma-70 family RNA polymerase sigma factor [Candidatus Poribacteria bacterium]|nr:sigma-70 family RNA polymerase sigma factor [Candidatus Poribacteria bacterium]MYK22015.1 sigma-70 family RNA polymerase sigma factor [Candidatus Poribacteria bacterium]
MEIEDDVQLIHAVLSGDDSAFGILVEKYQKSVHALAWQKIGDFHYAEEITQDTFLRAYQKLSTLKDPSCFSRWLHVIVKRICLNRLRCAKPAEQLQSLADTQIAAEGAQCAYDRYVSEQRETEADEHRSEIVKKLLEKLPEGERTVMTLYYLGEMTTEDIAGMLGVSVEAIRVRLHRARKRLQQEEELFIQGVLGGVQIPASIKQNITREVVDMKPTPSSRMGPFSPWVVFGTALAVAILLIFVVSNLNLAPFQKLYRAYFASNDRALKDGV